MRVEESERLTSLIIRTQYAIVLTWLDSIESSHAVYLPHMILNCEYTERFNISLHLIFFLHILIIYE